MEINGDGWIDAERASNLSSSSSSSTRAGDNFPKHKSDYVTPSLNKPLLLPQRLKDSVWPRKAFMTCPTHLSGLLSYYFSIALFIPVIGLFKSQENHAIFTTPCLSHDRSQSSWMMDYLTSCLKAWLLPLMTSTLIHSHPVVTLLAVTILWKQVPRPNSHPQQLSFLPPSTPALYLHKDLQSVFLPLCFTNGLGAS